MSIIVPKIKQSDGSYTALIYDSWPVSKYSLLTDKESYLVEFSGEVLKTNKKSILSDGRDFVEISFPAINEVDFILNDEIWSVLPENGWATIEVASIVPGVLNISVGKYQEKVIVK